MSTPTIYVVVPVHNRRLFTERFIASLDAQDIEGVRIHLILVDDGSTDGSDTLIANRHDASLIGGDGTWWWAGSVARALDYLKSTITTEDFVYLGNNDTVLAPDHLRQLLDTARANPRSVVGSVSFEIWPTGEHHPVSSGFLIDPQSLTVSNLPGDTSDMQVADALAGRGLLMPAQAASAARLHPRLLPQHFADLAFTYGLKKQGFSMLVSPEARSTQLERAGSSVQFAPRLADMFSKRSQLYIPAIASFWWLLSSPTQRLTLLPRLAKRGLTQLRAGAYEFS